MQITANYLLPTHHAWYWGAVLDLNYTVVPKSRSLFWTVIARLPGAHLSEATCFICPKELYLLLKVIVLIPEAN